MNLEISEGTFKGVNGYWVKDGNLVWFRKENALSAIDSFSSSDEELYTLCKYVCDIRKELEKLKKKNKRCVRCPMPHKFPDHEYCRYCGAPVKKRLIKL